MKTKIFSYILSISMIINIGTASFATVVEETATLSAVYSLPKAASLAIEIRTISQNNIVGSLTFNGFNLPNFGVNNPWVVADQYVRIIYSCNYPSWGIRVVTDNEINIGGIEPKWDKGKDGGWGKVNFDDDGNGIIDDWPEHGTPGTDDNAYYGGLINMDKKNNSTIKADLAWQIYPNFLGNGVIPNAPDKDDAGVKPVNPEDGWKTNWAYIVDRSNTGYTSQIITDYIEKEVNGEIQILAVYNYNIAIFGGGAKNGLAQHPPNGEPPSEKSGDGDVAMYICSRFCSKDYLADPNNPNGVDFVLPKGNYKTTIYIEIDFE